MKIQYKHIMGFIRSMQLSIHVCSRRGEVVKTQRFFSREMRIPDRDMQLRRDFLKFWIWIFFNGRNRRQRSVYLHCNFKNCMYSLFCVKRKSSYEGFEISLKWIVFVSPAFLGNGGCSYQSACYGASGKNAGFGFVSACVGRGITNFNVQSFFRAIIFISASPFKYFPII